MVQEPGCQQERYRGHVQGTGVYLGSLRNMSHSSQKVAAAGELNGSMREFGMPTELWCRAEADWKVENWMCHWSSPGWEHRRCFG